jgi:hypothetical protein
VASGFAVEILKILKADSTVSFPRTKKKKKKKIPVIFSSRTLSLPQPDRILFPWNWARFVTYDQSNAADI